MRLKPFYCFLFIFIINFCNSQIVNSSSNYTNNIEYNTGEIFVVYNFNSNLVTSKEVVTNENQVTNEKSIQIKIYPNPTENIVYFYIPNEMKFESLGLYDQYQKIIFTSIENTKQISLEHLPSGIYYIMFNNNKEHNYKIIKN